MESVPPAAACLMVNGSPKKTAHAMAVRMGERKVMTVVSDRDMYWIANQTPKSPKYLGLRVV